jgi:hypothetical protein
MGDTQAIETAKVDGRRTLHFNSIDDALADIDALEGPARAGAARCLGNWTIGQILGHLASWVEYSFDGVPMKKPPLVLRLVLRPMKHRFLYKPMRPGSNIPGVPGGTLGFERLSLDAGLSRYRNAFSRLRGESPVLPHVIFGPLTHDQWINQHLRHAELHLSFIRAD